MSNKYIGFDGKTLTVLLNEVNCEKYNIERRLAYIRQAIARNNFPTEKDLEEEIRRIEYTEAEMLYSDWHLATAMHTSERVFAIKTQNLNREEFNAKLLGMSRLEAIKYHRRTFNCNLPRSKEYVEWLIETSNKKLDVGRGSFPCLA